VKQSGLPVLFAGRGAGNSCLGEKGAVQRSGLPELIAELARSEAAGEQPREIAET
jgi:hypothetical protein